MMPYNTMFDVAERHISKVRKVRERLGNLSMDGLNEIVDNYIPNPLKRIYVKLFTINFKTPSTLEFRTAMSLLEE